MSLRDLGYWHNINSTDAQNILLQYPENHLYLLRDSSIKGRLAITIKLGGKFYNARILSSYGRYALDTFPVETIYYPSLGELLLMGNTDCFYSMDTFRDNGDPSLKIDNRKETIDNIYFQ